SGWSAQDRASAGPVRQKQHTVCHRPTARWCNPLPLGEGRTTYMLARFVKSGAQLALVYISGSFGFGFQQMAAFLVPLRARELSAPLDQIGIIVGAGAIVPALLSVWSGELADRFGARRTYIGGTIVAAACGVLMFAATS